MEKKVKSAIFEVEKAQEMGPDFAKISVSLGSWKLELLTLYKYVL